MSDLDLYIAILGMVTISSVAFRLGCEYDRFSKSSIFVFLASVVFALVFCVAFHADLGWAIAIPVSSVVVWSNLTSIVLCFAIGVLWSSQDIRLRSKPILIAALGMLSIACLVTPIARPILSPIVLDEAHSSGLVCLQSHESTCAPASAATLLRLNGIESNEENMVDLCLTSRRGTEALGLFRGLKIGCRDHGLHVGIASKVPGRWIENNQLPNVALVRFPENEFATNQNARFTARRFLGRGQPEGHAIVVLGYDDGKWTIADPAIGLVKWSDEEMRVRFTGDAMYLSQMR